MTLIISVLSSFSTIKILIGRFKNYHITRTVPLPAATVVYCKINALPAGNRPEITVRFAFLVDNSFSSHVKSAVTPKMVATMRVALLVYCELNGTLHLIVFYSLSTGPPSSKFCSSDDSSATAQFQSCPSEGARTCQAYCTS